MAATTLELPFQGVIVSALAEPYSFPSKETGEIIEGTSLSVSIAPEGGHPFVVKIRDEEGFANIEEAGFGAAVSGRLRVSASTDMQNRPQLGVQVLSIQVGAAAATKGRRQLKAS